MLVQSITYTNLLGVKKTKDCYFHLSKPELLRLELEFEDVGGMSEVINRFSEGKLSNAEMLHFLERLIVSSYGELSDDGDTFSKSDEISDNFRWSAVYEELLWSIITDASAETATAFFNGIVPEIPSVPQTNANN